MIFLEFGFLNIRPTVCFVPNDSFEGMYSTTVVLRPTQTRQVNGPL